MPSKLESPAFLRDDDLVVRLRALARDERRATATLVAALAEFERRRLYLSQGCSSLFTYCTEVLHFSEHAAYTRMEVARTALRFPVVVERLEDGSVTLTTIRRLGPVLTEANHREVLAAATHKKTAEVELLAATLRPRPDAKTIVRRLPPPRTAGPGLQPAAASATPSLAAPDPSIVAPTAQPAVLETPAAPATPGAPATAATPGIPALRSASPPTVVSAIAADRYRIQFTASRAMHDKLRLAQALLRHRIPTGDLVAIFERALDLLLAELAQTKYGATLRPRPQKSSTLGSRHIPAAVKREVWQRDDGRCAFVGTEGRCSERGFLELHHVVPFADGGPATAGNIELRCRAHNAYEAEQLFGPLVAREVGPAYNSFQDQ
jgi:hypothetical protein